MWFHPVYRPSHVFRAIGRDTRELLKRVVDFFELVKNEFRKLFHRRRMTDRMKDGELLHMFIKNES